MPGSYRDNTSLLSRITDLSHDQDSTDLQKCLLCAEQWLEKEHMAVDETTILAIGEFQILLLPCLR